MPGQSAERVWVSAQVPANYRSSLLARAEREDRSMSALVRAALSAFLFDEAGPYAPTENGHTERLTFKNST
jgi:hypothetical protein